MGLLLWLSKPLWYIAFFTVAAWRLRKLQPEQPLRPWLRGLLGGLARTLVGAGLGWSLFAAELMSANGLGEKPFGTALFLLLGFGAWLGVGKMVFKHASWRFLLGFAALGEILGGAVDLWALHDASTIRFC